MNDTKHMDEKKAYSRAMENLRNDIQHQIVRLTEEIHLLKVDFQRQKIINELNLDSFETVDSKDFLLPENDISMDQYDRMLERKRRKLAELNDVIEQLKRM